MKIFSKIKQIEPLFMLVTIIGIAVAFRCAGAIISSYPSSTHRYAAILGFLLSTGGSAYAAYLAFTWRNR